MFTNVTVDKTGSAGGRPFKLNASAYNTFNSVTVKNAVNNPWYNGMSIEYYSSHNTFNNCVVANDSGDGIIGWGQYDQYNTFNNCTVSGSSIYQVWAQSTDDYWTINGGTYTGAAGNYDLGLFGNNHYVHGATINGPGTVGIYVSANNACINNNTFGVGTGLGAGVSVSNATDIGSGNIMNGFSSNLPSGSCSPGPTFSPSPSNLTFGAQTVGTTSSPQTVTLTNNGTNAYSLTIGSIVASGDFAQTNTCGTAVAAGGQCTITVTFTPLASGSRNGNVTVNDNASGTPHSITITGTGI
jgi:hypothetical protein